MSQSAAGDPVYVPGWSEDEARRLERQAELFERPTRRLFEDAGITTGMRVLDLGSGAGDVAFLAAALVGPTGRVVGVELNPASVDRARTRARGRPDAGVGRQFPNRVRPRVHTRGASRPGPD